MNKTFTTSAVLLVTAVLLTACTTGEELPTNPTNPVQPSIITLYEQPVIDISKVSLDVDVTKLPAPYTSNELSILANDEGEIIELTPEQAYNNLSYGYVYNPEVEQQTCMLNYSLGTHDMRFADRGDAFISNYVVEGYTEGPLWSENLIPGVSTIKNATGDSIEFVTLKWDGITDPEFPKGPSVVAIRIFDQLVDFSEAQPGFFETADPALLLVQVYYTCMEGVELDMNLFEATLDSLTINGLTAKPKN